MRIRVIDYVANPGGGTRFTLELLAALMQRYPKIEFEFVSHGLALDTYRRLLAALIALLFAIQAAVIIAGNLRVIPTTGITLPFVSYGGSSLLVNFPLVGMLLGVSHAGRVARRQ